ncbi:hypothetical protein NDU88_001019 [Pleurodeles waltl]|uniref:Uncharacterized protein n=1 Tax=Pleurodeles waltl TaxID=8319 RepID=A0AAV7LZT7_PLEWA|nr:hypothetical protein NDU88_001019 [Pleurodeles waltl]
MRETQLAGTRGQAAVAGNNPLAAGSKKAVSVNQRLAGTDWLDSAERVPVVDQLGPCCRPKMEANDPVFPYMANVTAR